jgi:N-methylhydantoinase A
MHPGQFSAYGFIVTSARVDRQRTTQLTSLNFDGARAIDVMESLVEQAVGELKEQGSTKHAQVSRSLEMRYLGQNYELELPVAADALSAERVPQLWAAFHEAHKSRFGFSIPGEIIEIVNYLVTATSAGESPELLTLPEASGPPKPVASRLVVFPGARVDTPVYRRTDLGASQKISGPAVIEEAASVTIVNPGQILNVDRFGTLHLAHA